MRFQTLYEGRHFLLPFLGASLFFWWMAGDPSAFTLWLGPAGTISPLHRDRVNVLNVQSFGSKRITMIDSCQLPRVYNEQSFYSMVDVERPDLERFPEFGNVTVRQAVLEPGDAVFIPINWWHQLRALQISISVAFTNFRLDNTFGNRSYAE